MRRTASENTAEKQGAGAFPASAWAENAPRGPSPRRDASGSIARMQVIDSLGPWRGVLVAALAAAAWGAALRLLRWPDLAAAAAGMGLVAGWLVTLPLVLSVSPRQLLERLPLLVLAALGVGLLLSAPARLRGVLPAAAVLAALLAGWWMAGAPMGQGALDRAWPVALGVAMAAGFALWRLGRGASSSPGLLTAVALALAAGLWAARAPGPGIWLALAAAAAAAGGALVTRTPLGFAALLPASLGLAAVAALPVLARGRSADWAAAAAPALVLLLGPGLSARIGGRLGPVLGWALAAAPAVVAAAFFSSRFP